MDLWCIVVLVDLKQTIQDNVSALSPALLAEVNQLVVKLGHKVAGKQEDKLLAARYDSKVIKTKVHFPTMWVCCGMRRGV